MGTRRRGQDAQEATAARRRGEDARPAKLTERPRGYSRDGVIEPTRDAEPGARAERDSTSSADSLRGDSRDSGKEKANADDEDMQTEPSAETTTLRISNFRRPFTLNAVQAYVQQCGPMVDGGFWMDSIKTHCFVTYESLAVAKQTRDLINGVVWPAETGQPLSVTYSTTTAMEVVLHGPPRDEPRVTLKRKASGDTTPRSRLIKGRGAPVSIDSRFLKTEAKPMLYFLPVSDKEVATRKRERQRKTQEGQPVKTET